LGLIGMSGVALGDDSGARTQTGAAPATSSKAPEEKAKSSAATDAMHQMQAMHEKMMAAKTPAERQALMTEHMAAMQQGMSAMQQMHGSSSMPMRMDMMTMMMQMMMDRQQMGGMMGGGMRMGGGMGGTPPAAAPAPKPSK